MQYCPVSKALPESNSFSQWSPIELSCHVLEINNSCVHVSRSILSNLHPLSKARPRLSFSWTIWDLSWIPLQHLSYYKSWWRRKASTTNRKFCTVLLSFSIYCLTYLRLTSIGSFESTTDDLQGFLKNIKMLYLTCKRNGVISDEATG